MAKKKEKFDVILIQPNITWVYDPFEHLGLAYLASSLRQNCFKVKIIDAVLDRLSMAELYKKLDEYDIGVLGVTMISHGYLNTIKFLEVYRSNHPETKILGGGHFATFAAEKILNHTSVFDGIALGEGEYSLVNYCKNVLRQEDVLIHDIQLPDQSVNRSFNRILDMDDLPFPSRDYLKLAVKRGAVPSLTSSRGCSARCSFCTVHNFYKAKNGPRWISRSVENTIEELKYLHKDFNVHHFMFVDDNFIGPGPKGREKAIEFAEAYRKSGLPMTFHIDCRAVNVTKEVFEALVAAGLKSVFIGIESVSHNDLVLYKKGLKVESNWEAVKTLKKYNLNYTLSMIMFNPLTDKKSILDNINFLLDARYYPRNPISILNFYEGTDANKSMKEFISGPFWDYRFKI